MQQPGQLKMRFGRIGRGEQEFGPEGGDRGGFVAELLGRLGEVAVRRDDEGIDGQEFLGGPPDGRPVAGRPGELHQAKIGVRGVVIHRGKFLQHSPLRAGFAEGAVRLGELQVGAVGPRLAWDTVR